MRVGGPVKKAGLRLVYRQLLKEEEMLPDITEAKDKLQELQGRLDLLRGHL